MFETRQKTVNKVVLIKAASILPNPAQPRKTFEDAALESLSQSIKENGLLQPISVRKSANGLYELIAGERRLRAAKLSGLNEIPCIVTEATPKQSAVLAILENLQRSDLNPIEEADALYKLIVEWNVTQEDAAARLGMAQSTIANKLRLLKLAPETRGLVSEQKLNERQARALLKLTDPKIQAKAAGIIARDGLNVAESERLVGQLLLNSRGADLALSSKRDKPKRKIIVKDIRLFINTINNAVSTMKRAGIMAKTERNDCGDYIEYKVRIPVQRV